MESTVMPAIGAALQIGICDDSREDREYYEALLRKVAEKHHLEVNISLYHSGASVCFGLEDAKKPIDILFMDIFMPDEDGLSVSRKLRQQEDSTGYSGELIFLTKSEKYAIEAFDVNAFHYIVKGQTTESKIEEIFLTVVEKIDKRNKKHLILRGVGEYCNIDVDSILYFEIVHRVITVHYGSPERTFEFYCSMDKLEEIVLPFGLLRNHKSFIVQCRRVVSLSRSGITLDTGDVLPVGRSYYNVFKALFDEMVANKEKAAARK